MSECSEVRTDGNSLLKAVHLSRLRLTRLLLEGGAYINESNDRGETPLMVACRTQHADAQSVPKHKIVRYLLESGADPNIQDKTGRTALMHACLQQAGAEVLSLLLNSGADPSLEDHAGSSALVYAVNSGDKEVLRVLLDACKAKGKEVIIITTDRLPSGGHMTKQYLNVPPPPDLEERLHYPAAPCCTMSPSDIQLHAPPQEPHTKPNTSPPQFGSPLMGLRDPKGSASGPPPCLAVVVACQPGSPTRGDPRPSPPGGPGGVNKLLNLQRLPSEPRLKIPPSLQIQQNQNQASSLTEELTVMSPEDDPSFRVSSHGGPHGGRPPAVSRHHSIDVKDATGLLKALGRSPESQATGGALGGVKRGLLGRKMSYDSTATSSASHPNLHPDDGCPRPQETADKGSSECLPHLAVSSLRNVVRRRNIGMDHYSSDSQLPQFGHQHRDDGSKSTAGAGAGLERRKLANSRSSPLTGSRESLENAVQRRSGTTGLERRGSGALLLDHISHIRPRYLPPLNPHAPIPDIGVSPASSGHFGGSSKALNGVAAGSKPTIQPCAPSFPRDLKVKNLLRRHSMQTEQLKQLVNFEELFGH